MAIWATAADQSPTTYAGAAPNRMWSSPWFGTDKLTDQEMINLYNSGSSNGKGGSGLFGTIQIPGLPNPIGNVTSGVGNVVGAVESGANATAGAAENVGDFLGKLANPNLWVRVAEFLVGGVLLGVAVNGLLKNPAGKIGKTVASGASTAAFPAKSLGKTLIKGGGAAGSVAKGAHSNYRNRPFEVGS